MSEQDSNAGPLALWQGYGANDEDAMIHAAFQAKYGYPAAVLMRIEGVITLAGPIRETTETEG